MATNSSELLPTSNKQPDSSQTPPLAGSYVTNWLYSYLQYAPGLTSQKRKELVDDFVKQINERGIDGEI
jgi:hypothetical protein